MNIVEAFLWLDKEISEKKPNATQQAILFAVMRLLNKRFWKGGVELREIKEVLGSDIRTVQNGVQRLKELGMLKMHSTGKVGINNGREQAGSKGETKRGDKPVGKSLADLATERLK